MKDIGRTSAARSIDKKFESRVVNRADEVIVVSNSLIKNYKDTGREDFHVLPNGFDDDDFKNLTKSESDKFRILYAGGLSASQNPVSLFKALAALDESLKHELEINFYGSFHSSISEAVESMGLNSLVKLNNFIPHKQAIKKMADSEMLLLLIPDTPDNEGIITGKFFEYLASRNFILAVGPENGDVAGILAETGSGKVINYNTDPTKIILEQIERWKSKEDLQINEEALSKYTRRGTTQKLAQILSD